MMLINLYICISLNARFLNILCIFLSLSKAPSNMSPNVCGYEKLPKAIWVEALQEPSLISAVMCPERSVAE